MPLFILPFDHRAGLASELFGYDYKHLGKHERANMILAKEIIFQAFLKAKVRLDDQAMILVDEEFGDAILRRARKAKIPYILTTEKSNTEDFELIHGKSFGTVLKKRTPAFAKALIHYPSLESAGKKRLRELSTWCAKNKIPLLLEPLLGTEQPSAQRMIAMMDALHDAGVHPALWKVEGLQKSADWKKVRAAADAPIVVLGRASSKKKVSAWITAAAESGYVQGFAIGRTVFLEPLKKYFAGTISEEQVTELIARSFLSFVALWNRAAA